MVNTKNEKMDEAVKTIHQLDKTDKKIREVSKQLVLLKHEYRKTRDSILKLEIKKKWDKLQKKIDSLEKRRLEIIEKKNELDYKRKWKDFKKTWNQNQ